MSNQVAVIVADASPLGTLLAVAKTAGNSPAAIVVGPRKLAEAVAEMGVSSVSWINASDSVPVEAYSASVAEAIKKMDPAVVLSTNSASARVLAGIAAGTLDAATVSDVLRVAFEGGQTEIEHYIADQRAVEMLSTSAPVVGLVADGSDDVEVVSAVSIDEVPVAEHAQMTILGTDEGEAGGADLANADRVVGAGRGLTDKAQLALIEDLASALGAEVACSLSLCDDYHWFEHGRVVGTSTQRISPRLYVSVGISGQPQHMTGVRSAKTIVAINNDPDAPIFRNCAYGIVGDLNKVVPALTEALKN